MKKLILPLFFLISSALAQAGTTYQVDQSSSQVKWLGEKITDKHNGTIKIKSGKAELKGTQLVTAEFVVDMTTIENRDLDDETYRNKLVNHLKSEDFFDVKKYPEAKLVVTKVKSKNGEFKPNTKDMDASFEGNLTIKEITHPVKFDGKISDLGSALQVISALAIDRTKWNVKYNSKRFFDPKKLGDKIIKDEIKLDFDVQLKKI